MITVVSGLPRSGTSMMMQMLEAGGMPVLTDGVRGADEDNPRGYYEVERVKHLGRDAGWISEAEGRAIKVVSMLLYDLPGGHDYSVIFMTRDLGEVLASQAAMLRRLGRDEGGDGGAMRGHFEAHLAKLRDWLRGRRGMRVLECGHAETVRDPRASSARVADFLGESGLDIDRMASAVTPELHRQRASGGGRGPE